MTTDNTGIDPVYRDLWQRTATARKESVEKAERALRQQISAMSRWKPELDDDQNGQILELAGMLSVGRRLLTAEATVDQLNGRRVIRLAAAQLSRAGHEFGRTWAADVGEELAALAGAAYGPKLEAGLNSALIKTINYTIAVIVEKAGA